MSKKGGGPKVKCLHCGDIIQSLYRHDFRWCSCKSIAVDGGNDYLHSTHTNKAHWTYNLDAPLVGPRDTSTDREWCHRCNELVLKTDTEERKTIIWGLNDKKSLETRHFCKTACKPKENK